jgi:hypothetical protein
MINTAARERAHAKQRAGMPASAAAAAYIDNFRNQPSVINYIAAKWHNRQRRRLLRWHLQYARIAVREFINRFRGQDQSLREPPLGRLFRHYWSLFLTAWTRRYFHILGEEELKATKYFYFPLHKEAELAQTFQASLWHDQRNTVRVLASLLPAGYRLLIREHRMNCGYRPARSYRELAQLPNVVIIDPYDSQFKYLRHADLVVTENGSSGWEGLLLGRRVLLLSRSFYDGAGAGVTVSDPDRLNAAILDMLAKPPVQDPAVHAQSLGRMIDAEMETTFRMSEDGRSAALDMLAETLAGVFRKPSAHVREDKLDAAHPA